MLVYSLVEYSSFNEMRQFHAKITRLKDTTNLPIVLVGNKLDLAEEHRAVKTEEGEALAKEWNAIYLETSAKTAVNVEGVFFNLVRQIRKLREPLSPSEGEKKKRRGCVVL